MNAHQNEAFSKLLEAWKRREEVRSHGNLGALLDARQQLDAARLDMAIQRRSS
jgi:hypothetical protein